MRQLKDAGAWVTVLQRKNDDRAEIEKMGAFLCKGDALVDKDVKKAYDMVEEYDAVVSTVGGTPASPEVDFRREHQAHRGGGGEGQGTRTHA